MSFSSLEEIVNISNAENVPFWTVICEDECREQNCDYTVIFEKMRDMYRAMKEADAEYDAKLRSHSGMAGGDGELIEQLRGQSDALLGDFLLNVMAKAVKMAESNACMRRIVAAPTAGSCGVIPAVLIAYQEYRNVPEDKMVEALFVAGGIGEIIAQNASISGAEGGCQAEIGSASAMAAGALTYLEGGSNEQILNALSFAMKNMLGLTCDPVAGLVEVPCIKRNVAGAVNAITSSQIAMAGVVSRIPADEVIDSMRRIGQQLPACLRETSQGGLATSRTGIEIAEAQTKQ